MLSHHQPELLYHLQHIFVPKPRAKKKGELHAPATDNMLFLSGSRQFHSESYQNDIASKHSVIFMANKLML
jgi:hypothetical protein